MRLSDRDSIREQIWGMLVQYWSTLDLIKTFYKNQELIVFIKMKNTNVTERIIFLHVLNHALYLRKTKKIDGFFVSVWVELQYSRVNWVRSDLKMSIDCGQKEDRR